MQNSYRIKHLKNRSKKHAILKTMLMLFCLLTLTSSAAFATEVFTDRADYPPGDSVVIIGVAFQPYETVTVQISHLNGDTPDLPIYDPWDLSADDFGDFETFWIVPDTALGETLLVTATGQSSGFTASTVFTDCNTELSLLTTIPDPICPGTTIDVCAALYEKCSGGTLAPLEDRPLLFFVNEGNCGVNVGQMADATVDTDVNGVACATLTIPSTPGEYSIRVKFLGESKPGPSDPPNSACSPGSKVNLSASNDCETTTADQSACNEPPVCSVPADQTFFQCTPTQVSLPVSCSDPDGNLAAGYPMIVFGPGSIVGSNWVYTPSGDETAVVTIRCEDDAGAFCEATFTITFDINSAPVITCPADITINCNESTDPTNTGSATAIDDNGTPTITYSDSEVAGSCPQEKVITRTWTATDGCSAADQCQQTITVIDNTPPVITCPANVTIECDESTDPTNTGTATATDICDATVAISYSDATAGNVITRTWTATDDCGNSSSCDQIITVEDTTPPVITCPANVTIECDGSTDPSNTGSATATDNCDTSPTITYSDTETAGTCPQEKIITRTWTATDDANNSATCGQTITVEDTTPPVIACPADVTIECDESTDPTNTGSATAVDNCDPSPTITYYDVPSGNIITRTWTATDACGNSSTCDQIITLDDTTPPVITCPADITIECDESIDPSNTGSATATDNCDTSPTITYSDTETAGTCPQEKIITRTWTATDDANNSATCDQTIAVEDNTPPVITCPADVTVECDGSIDPSATGSATATDNCDATVTITYSDATTGNVITRTWTATDDCDNSSTCDQLLTIDDTTPPVITCPANVTIECDESTDPSNTGSATATDNCDTSPTITYSDTETAGTCPQEKIITRTWTATDNANNSATCDQTITVEDTTPPVITCPDDVTVECDGSIDPSATGSATATDNCDATVTITYSDATTGNVITRTWTATDDCSNSSTCDQLLTIDDTTPPVITCPTDVTIECDESTDPSNTGSATATDNCDVSVTITYSDTETAGTCPQEKVITRTWTATDDANNSATCDQTITVEDTTPPVITCPDDVTVECDGSIDPSATGSATAVDNCDPSPTITYFDVPSGNIITRTWTATDACGNSSTCDQIITLDDTTPPVITCPADITIECDESTDPSNTGSATATDNCDVSVTITYSDTETAGTCPQEKVITRTWTATDDANNSATCDQTITVEDTTPPVITCPADVTVECDGTIDPSATGSATATDNCDATVTITYSDATTGNVITRTWTATDDCDNSSTCDQLITIIENAVPQASCPGDMDLLVCDLSPITISGFSCSDPDGNLATCEVDNGTLTDGSVTFTPVEGENIITLTATDECGETASCAMTVTVTINSEPEPSCPADTEVFVCSLEEICLPGFDCTDSDDNLVSCETSVGYLDGNILCFTPVEGVNTVVLTATDEYGATAECTVNITVIDNTPPVAHCPGDMTLYLFELEEICIPGFYCEDIDNNLSYCNVDIGTFIGDEVCFIPVEGENIITLTAIDDCGSKAVVTNQTIVTVVLISSCLKATISKEIGVLQGQYRDVTVTIDNATYEMGGFDFLIAYDASAISAMEVTRGQLLEDCGWEYFTYRYGADGNCGDACPSGLLRIFALAETNDGYNNPSCFGPPDQALYNMFTMRFFVTNDRTFECQFVPINFFWGDCGDNSISNSTGDTLFVDRLIYDFTGNLIWDEEDDDQFPEDARIPFVGAPNYCLDNPMPDKPTAIRCIDFRHGGINIICADDIDDRGDLNLNGIPNEIADAVVFTNYFIYGLDAFVVNSEGQIAASDTNADGISLSVADLVYIIRVINGDVLPIDKIIPYESTVGIGSRGSIVEANAELGGAAFVFEGNVEVDLTENASHMQIKSNFDGVNTRVVVYSFDQGAVFSGGILRTEGKLLSVEASDYFGNLYKIGQLPQSFSLTSYPNPFNPSTTIEMTLPIASDWTVDIFNISGQKVVAYEGTDEAGLIKVTWDATGQSSGIYFIKAQAGNYKATKKAILLK